MNRIKVTCAASVAALAAISGTASAQVFINEVWENPPGSTDAIYEYIELYGRPGMSLDGFALGQLKGGFDQDGDDIPDGTGGDNIPEIDEAYSLDGLSLGANGFLVIYNDNNFNSAIPFFLPPETTSATFADVHIPTTDTAGSLNNDGSSSYVLVRLRANPSNFRKEVKHDANFDGKIDFGTEPPPFFGTSIALAVQPLQRVNEFAWSDNGGKEYVADSENEISDTPGFNPDAASRVRYYVANPMRGHRTRDLAGGGFEIVPTRIADESWVYGEIPSTSVSLPESLVYDTSVDIAGNLATKAPTDRDAQPFDGSCDPEPAPPASGATCLPAPGGDFFFTDLVVDGFALTPGDYNDGVGVFQYRLAAAQSGVDLPPNFDGQLFRDGDFDFNGVIDCDDLALIESRVGASLDDTTPGTDPFGLPVTDYTWQNADLQAVMIMLAMDTADDGMGGNASVITQADVDATAAALDVSSCPGDTNGDDVINADDLLAVLGNFGQSDVCGAGSGDVDNSFNVNADDLLIVLANFGSACGG